MEQKATLSVNSCTSVTSVSSVSSDAVDDEEYYINASTVQQVKSISSLKAPINSSDKPWYHTLVRSNVSSVVKKKVLECKCGHEQSCGTQVWS